MGPVVTAIYRQQPELIRSPDTAAGTATAAAELAATSQELPGVNLIKLFSLVTCLHSEHIKAMFPWRRLAR